jgi:hypothetical protein
MGCRARPLRWAGAFRVKVMARGEVHVRMDPFLSPVRPVIED